MKSTLLMVALGLLAFENVAAAATVTVTASKDLLSDCVIRLDGRIDSKTPKEVQAVFEKLKPECALYEQTIVLLNSPGGDLEASLAVGRIIRNKSAATSILSKASCASACVYAFLGGVYRFGLGKIGLHRAYATSLSKSRAESQASIVKANKLVRDYLDEMLLPTRILDLANAMPPDEIRWLESIEFNELAKELQIAGKDAAWSDLKVSEQARKFDISKAQYYQFEQRSDEECKGKSNSFVNGTMKFEYMDCRTNAFERLVQESRAAKGK